MVVDLLRNLGYNDVQINRIINDVSLIKRTDEKLKNSIINVYDFLKDMGYSSEEIISITTLSPTLFNLSKEKIKEKIDYFIGLGFTKAQIKK